MSARYSFSPHWPICVFIHSVWSCHIVGAHSWFMLDVHWNSERPLPRRTSFKGQFLNLVTTQWPSILVTISWAGKSPDCRFSRPLSTERLEERRSPGSRLKSLGFSSQFCCLILLNFLTSLGLHFLICAKRRLEEGWISKGSFSFRMLWCYLLWFLGF